MAKGDFCRVSNCKNKITHKGTVCGTHKWRIKKFNSYDLPNHEGEPNYYQKINLPNGILKICKVHGELSLESTYIRYYKGNPNYACMPCALNRQMKNKFDGLDEQEYIKMFSAQSGLCKICKKPESTTRNGKLKKMAVDHCHLDSSKGVLTIRGLLCQFCNSGLGYFRDSIEILKAAIKYLEENSEN